MPFSLPHVGEQLLDDLVGLGPVHPLVGLRGQVDAGQDLLLRLLAEAFERLHLVGFAGGAQLVERGDAQLLVQRGRLLRPQAGDADHRQHAAAESAAAALRASAIVPVSSSSPIFSARSLPMPSMSVSSRFGSAAIFATASDISTMFDDHDKVFQSICAGASGYLLKTSPQAEITEGIREVLAGGAPMNARIARSVLEMFAKLAAPKGDYGLTAREGEVLELMVRGLIKKEIADRLSLSYHTIDSHLRNIYQKLHVHARTGAVAKAIKERLF